VLKKVSGKIKKYPDDETGFLWFSGWIIFQKSVLEN
jgi:hypothetical protein